MRTWRAFSPRPPGLKFSPSYCVGGSSQPCTT
nr:MAG TPA: hypothetical protein [Caudoviricetes sp.]